MSVKIFICYAHEDEALLIRLKTHLNPLERQGLIKIWYDQEIGAGSEWEREISQRLNQAQIILLLVSPDFMASEYCYGTELKQALEKHERGEALVVPVIGRAVYWQGILGHLQALPKDALPVTDPKWQDQDSALYSVVEGIRKIVNSVLSAQEPPTLAKDSIGRFDNIQGSAPEVDQFSQDIGSRTFSQKAFFQTVTSAIVPSAIVQSAKSASVTGYFLVWLIWIIVVVIANFLHSGPSALTWLIIANILFFISAWNIAQRTGTIRGAVWSSRLFSILIVCGSTCYNFSRPLELVHLDYPYCDPVNDGFACNAFIIHIGSTSFAIRYGIGGTLFLLILMVIPALTGLISSFLGSLIGRHFYKD